MRPCSPSDQGHGHRTPRALRRRCSPVSMAPSPSTSNSVRGSPWCASARRAPARLGYGKAVGCRGRAADPARVPGVRCDITNRDVDTARDTWDKPIDIAAAWSDDLRGAWRAGVAARSPTGAWATCSDLDEQGMVGRGPFCDCAHRSRTVEPRGGRYFIYRPPLGTPPPAWPPPSSSCLRTSWSQRCCRPAAGAAGPQARMVLHSGFPPPDARRKRLVFPSVRGAETMDVTRRGETERTPPRSPGASA
ncbi:hypothetical protein SEVIR_2G319150v4 [Setaria viridis]